MRFLFEAAQDAANLAKNVMLGYLGRHETFEGERHMGYLKVQVQVGYTKEKTKGDVTTTDNIESARLNTLVAKYLEAHIEDALKYGVSVLEGGADTALVAAKDVLQGHLKRIADIEATRGVEEIHVQS